MEWRSPTVFWLLKNHSLFENHKWKLLSTISIRYSNFHLNIFTEFTLNMQEFCCCTFVRFDCQSSTENAIAFHFRWQCRGNRYSCTVSQSTYSIAHTYMQSNAICIWVILRRNWNLHLFSPPFHRNAVGAEVFCIRCFFFRLQQCELSSWGVIAENRFSDVGDFWIIIFLRTERSASYLEISAPNEIHQSVKRCSSV